MRHDVRKCVNLTLSEVHPEILLEIKAWKALITVKAALVSLGDLPHYDRNLAVFLRNYCGYSIPAAVKLKGVPSKTDTPRRFESGQRIFICSRCILEP